MKSSSIKEMEPSEGPSQPGGPEKASECCFFGQKVGVSKLENQVSSVQWPLLTKKQKYKKLKRRNVSLFTCWMTKSVLFFFSFFVPQASQLDIRFLGNSVEMHP